jgi:hypothetical protein
MKLRNVERDPHACMRAAIANRVDCLDHDMSGFATPNSKKERRVQVRDRPRGDRALMD